MLIPRFQCITSASLVWVGVQLTFTASQCKPMGVKVLRLLLWKSSLCINWSKDAEYTLISMKILEYKTTGTFRASVYLDFTCGEDVQMYTCVLLSRRSVINWDTILVCPPINRGVSRRWLWYIPRLKVNYSPFAIRQAYPWVTWPDDHSSVWVVLRYRPLYHVHKFTLIKAWCMNRHKSHLHT